MSLVATLSQQDVAATARYVLIDKSGTSGFPHGSDAPLRLEKLIVHGHKDVAAGIWKLKFGVVEEVDATNGSVTFFYTVPLGDQLQVDIVVPFEGLRSPGLSLAEAATHMLGIDDVNGSTNWQSDVTLVNPTGTNVAPGAGDLVLEAEEVDGTATLTFSVTALYNLASAHA